jgi:hypothetical protein
LKRWVLVLVVLAALAPGVSCLELTGGVRAGAGGSLFYGGWVDGLRGELIGLGAADVTSRVYISWHFGGWIEIPVRDRLSLRVEPALGPVGGALLASDGYDMLVGVSAIELAVPVLAATRISLPVGEVVLAAGIFIGGALAVRQIQNDGTIRSEGGLASVLACAGLAGGAGCAFPVGPGAITADLRVLASLFSIASPGLEGMLNTVSVELTAGWAFRPRDPR